MPENQQTKSNHDLPRSLDARIWAVALIQAINENPAITSDVDQMSTWFTEAIATGWNEATQRSRLRSLLCRGRVKF